MGVVIGTVGTSLQATGHRYLDRGPDGRLWAVRVVSTVISLWYSDNDGDNWAQATNTVTGSDASLFVDLDGGVNIIYTGTVQGISYRRGTVSGTTITWSSEHVIAGNVTGYDLVVFRNPAGSGWYALIAVRSGDGNNPHMVDRLSIVGTTINPAGTYILTNYAQGGSGFNGSIDFHHTGDGKTVQGGTPHGYVIYLDSVGDMYLTRFGWNGTGYTLQGGRVVASASGLPMLAFDGTRIVFITVEGTGQVRLYERDAGNTTTTDRGLTAALGAAFTGIPTVTYDRDGNVYVVAISSGDGDLYRIKWTRGTTTWGAWTAVQTGTLTGATVRVGWAGADWPTVEAVFKDATNLSYQEVLVINTTPNAPTVLTPVDGSTQDVAAALSIIWTFNDPDQGDAQTAYTVRKRIGAGAHTYWNGTTWAASESGATKIASAVTSLAVGSGWGADGDSDHHYSVKTWDALDQLSPWSAEHRVVPSGKDNPTITIPVSNGTVMDSATENVEWTVATQTKYRLRVVGDIGGTPDLSVVDYDSGIKIGSAVRLDTVQFPTNGQDRQIELTTWNDEGLQSTLTYRLVDVTYTPPADASLTLDVDSLVPGAIVVTINNSGEGAVEDRNDVYRREVGDTGSGIRIAANVDVSGSLTDYAVASGVDYEYQAKTYSTDGALSFSVWVS